MKPRLTEKQLKTQVRYFAYYQLAGGLLVMGFIAVALTQVDNLSGILFLIYTGFLALSGFTIYCGYLTLKQPYRGLQLSRISLLTQFLGFAAGGFAFRFFAGPFLALSIDLSQGVLFKADASLGEFNFKFNTSPDALLFSVNVAAIMLFLRTTFWLNKWRARH